jgi:hypothetical protein
MINQMNAMLEQFMAAYLHTNAAFTERDQCTVLASVTAVLMPAQSCTT